MVCCLVVLSSSVCPAKTNDLHHKFRETVAPFIESYCIDCHSGEKPKAKFDLSPYDSTESVIEDFGHWELVLDMLAEGEMPPEDEEKQPTAEARAEIVEWIRAIRTREAERNAGDPGLVLARRLSNAEYDYTIRDLTGVDIRPTREFPVDPANEAGFDNSGESLTLSPALLKKYLDAARLIGDHLVLKPDGFTFAPHPVATDTDRDKYCVNRIIEFYRRQPTDLADYFLAAWKVARSAGQLSVAEAARNSEISEKYLGTIYALLTANDLNAGPIGKLRDHWSELVEQAELDADAAREACEKLASKVQALRAKLAPKVPFLKNRDIHKGAQAFVLWHNRQKAANRRTLDENVLRIAAPDENAVDEVDPDLMLSSNEDERLVEIEAFRKFCSVFPDTFFVSERGREFLEKEEETAKNEAGRLLSAGFHSMMGYFRDDRPLCELILDEGELAELDALWRELDFVTTAPMRQHAGLVWFEKTDSRFLREPEFDFARAEDKDVTSEEKIRRLADAYLAKAIRSGAGDLEQQAITEHFTNINASVRAVEKARLEAIPSHLRDLLTFAERAYRRPLTSDEKSGLLAFHESLMQTDGASHEDAMRDCVVSVLVSPHFWYRVDLPAEEPGIQPLSDSALASRLSYFLWSSMPDDELRQLATSGKLRDPDVLKAQVRRMLRDGKVRALAREFGGNWLGFRQFQHHNSVDRERFPEFTNELRAAMFEEPIRLFTDIVQQNRSALDFLFAEDTFANAPLAAHYEVDGISASEDQWGRIEDARDVGRGGLLPMAVFQTLNAPGLRTSPVKRGYWVVRQVLGEHIPPPPPNVPELPADEGIGDLTLREQLVRHREDKNCAACHERFDSIGLAFEGYGPVGERRSVDLGGRPIDVQAQFPDGGEGAGLEGLLDYLREYRQDEFIDNLCRKLFSYALGRTLILSDNPTIEEMKTRLAADGFRMQSLIESIVTSPQFLNQRGRVELAQN